jgi:hypothetical protein
MRQEDARLYSGAMIAELLEAEHAEMERLLASGNFDEFRKLLLRHIGIEEKILLPAAREARGGESLPIARDLRRDHAEIAEILVYVPTDESTARLRAILARHNPLEEGPDGLYALCEKLAGPERTRELVERIRAAPPVRVAAYRVRGQPLR